jgi:hypothetical protein
MKAASTLGFVIATLYLCCSCATGRREQLPSEVFFDKEAAALNNKASELIELLRFAQGVIGSG